MKFHPSQKVSSGEVCLVNDFFFSVLRDWNVQCKIPYATVGAAPTNLKELESFLRQLDGGAM